MKNVIFIQKQKQTKEETIELTFRKKSTGWKIIMDKGRSYLNDCDKIVYLGNCKQDGDMFSVYKNGYIMIFKGNLNNGKY